MTTQHPADDRLRRADRTDRSRDARPAVRRRAGRCHRSRAPRRVPLSGLDARLFDADGRDGAIDLKPGIAGDLGERQLLWVDLDRRDGDDFESVAKDLGLRADDVANIAEEQGRARLTRDEDRLHLILEALEMSDDDTLVRREIDLVASKNLVVTVHDGPVEALRRFADHFDGETRLGALSAAAFMSSLVDEVLAGYFRLAEAIERDIDLLDQRALSGRPGDDVLGDLVRIRRRVSLIRRTLAPHRYALAAMARPDMQVEETIGEPWPGLVDRLDSAIAAIEGLRDSLLGTYDIHMGRTSQRANDVMKVLTLLSAILLPAVVLAGIMGMNFKLAIFDESTNFFLVLGAMVGLAVIILGVARWRRWL